MSSIFSRLRNRFYLARWSGERFVGKHKRIRINRVYGYYQSSVIDIHWSLREMKPDGTKGHPMVISERVSGERLLHVIRKVEKDELPKALQRFA
ncbi:MAG: hypothetical protein HUK03_08500, partial [Bacteroidaceae bacterium]|nr:hypothetical protein [Bacteroidaceae bacterium]